MNFKILFLLFSFFLLDGGSSLFAAEKGLSRANIGMPASRSVPSLPIEMGIKKGLYRKEGVDLEMYVMRSNIIEAGLKTGEIDYGGAPGDSIRSAAAGIPVKAIFFIIDKLPQYLVTRPEIKKVAELKGKTIGVGSLAGATAFAAREMVRPFGLNPDKDITIVATGPNMKMPALLAGSVDAAMVNSRESIRAQQKGFNQLLNAKDIIEISGFGLSTTDKKIRENRGEVKKAVKGALISMLYVKEKRSEAVDFMVKEWGVEKDLAPKYLEMDIEAYSKDGSVSDKVIQNELEVGRSMGMVKGDIPISKVADLSILKEVQKEMGLLGL